MHLVMLVRAARALGILANRRGKVRDTIKYEGDLTDAVARRVREDSPIIFHRGRVVSACRAIAADL